MSDDYTPAAGWYDDPERALRLRWWDGVRWTTHTRAKTIVDDPPAAEARPDMSSSDALAIPGMTQPYGYSAPYSWSPAMPSAAVASATEPTAAEPLGTFSTRTRRPDEIWNSAAQAMEYTPERTTTPAAWALAFTPVVVVLAQTAAIVLTGLESTPVIWVIGAAIIPVLWIIMWVRRDRITLHEWGHLRRAHWGWAFLGAIGYLVARAIVVGRQSRGRGWWPVAVNLALLAVLVNVGLFSPVAGLLRTVAF